MTRKILLNGANGKMCQRIKDLIAKNPSYNLEVVAERKNSDASQVGDIDLVMDFSLPNGAEQGFKIAKEKKVAFLTGTTGLSDSFIEEMIAEKEIPVFFAPNMSIGVYSFMQILKTAKEMFNQGYDVSVHEIHHTNKKDAPSGTAKKIAREIKFPIEEITYDRLEDVVGTHEIIFKSKKGDEDITLKHKAINRDLFANSAIFIANWLLTKESGCYKMKDYMQEKLSG